MAKNAGQNATVMRRGSVRHAALMSNNRGIEPARLGWMAAGVVDRRQVGHQTADADQDLHTGGIVLLEHGTQRLLDLRPHNRWHNDGGIECLMQVAPRVCVGRDERIPTVSHYRAGGSLSTQLLACRPAGAPS